jgi:FkbH-like protein
MLPNNVKLVIWDLDDTFWRGTLAEGEIVPIEACKQCVITLAERGVISSICSKNDFETAKAALSKIGVWDYFVFPRIEFGPKGQNIAAMIEEMGLRAENVLFIDDNVLNLEEAKHYAPGIMVADPAEILAGLLGLPQVAGKDDRALTRLNQYKSLEVKSLERAKSTVSNEEFLRQCDIQVTIDQDLDGNFDRIVEMANRTNQLNFTKKRLETPEAVAEFRSLCGEYGVATGVVSIVDRYGNYGVVGYYVVRRRTGHNELLHFAFSCRTMNMGIEQYIYEYLREPTIKIVGPVSNPIKTFAKVDWIKEGGGDPSLVQLNSNRELVLIGGCQLLQLASLCSTRRSEFVNTVRNGTLVRFDDAGFILSDRTVMAADRDFQKLGYWTYNDAAALDEGLKSSGIVIVALAAFLWENYYVSRSGTLVRIVNPLLNRHRKTNPEWFAENFQHYEMSEKQRYDLLVQALDRITDISPPSCDRFVLSMNTRGLPPAGAARGRKFNKVLERYCDKRRSFTYVDVGAVVSQDDQIDPDHFTRRGYMALANFISQHVSGGETEAPVLSQPGIRLVPPVVKRAVGL